MGAPGSSAYTGNPLAQNVQGAYTSALGASGEAATGGAGALEAAGGFGGSAADIYNNPGDLATADYAPYMNPFTQNVIDTTMADLTGQEAIAQQAIDDAALNQQAFGGDRMYLQKGQLGGEFAKTKANTLADLYMKNFGNAQMMKQFDIGTKLNQGAGLTNLAQLYGQLGSGMNQFGIKNLGDLANMGFGMGNQLQQNQLQAGALQQQQQQQLMDAIHAQYLGYTGSPQQSLQAYLGALAPMWGNVGGKTTGTTNPGALSWLGAGANAVGSIFPFGF